MPIDHSSMGFVDKIEQLRAAPIRKRKIILAILVVLSMALIVGAWILFLQSTSLKTASAADAEKPFQVLWNSVRENFKNTVKLEYKYEGK